LKNDPSSLKVIIVRDRDSSGGGIVNYYKAVAPHLAVEVRFCDVGKPHSYYAGAKSGSRFTVLRLMADWLALFFAILRFRPHIVHLNPGLDVTSFRSMRRDAVNLIIARLLGRRVLVFWRGWHNSWCGKPEFPKGNDGLLSRIYRKAAAHVVLSGRFREDLLRWGFTTPIYVETTVASDECLVPEAGLAQPGDGRMDLLFLSRVEVAKGVFELLEAYRLLRGEFPACTLTIAGDGPDLEALKARAAESGVTGVSFTGFISGAAKVECYRRASLFCFLSYTEGMPNAVLEALAMGLPVVSSDAGGLRDILRDGVTGTITLADAAAPSGKKFIPGEVAAAIGRLLHDPEQMKRIGKHNAEYARERFAAPKVAARLTGIYNEMLSPSARSLALSRAGGERQPAD